MKNILRMGIFLVIFLTFTGCEQALFTGTNLSQNQDTAVPETGTLTLKGEESNRELLMVSGVSETGQTMGLRSISASSSADIDLIPPGNWTIYYNYSDRDGRVLSYGSEKVNIRAGKRSIIQSDTVRVNCLPGEYRFIKEVLQKWFEPVFIKYEIDSYGSQYARFIRKLTYNSVHKLLGNSRSLTARRVWLENQGIDTDEIIRLFVDIMLWFDRGDFMAPMINEILAVYRDNMYHYFNIQVPYPVNLTIEGLPQNLKIEEANDYQLSAQPSKSFFDYLWIFNEEEKSRVDDWTLSGSMGVTGTNQLILQASYRGVVLGRNKAILLKEESNNRLLLTNVPFVSDSLRTLVLSTGLTYADELTTLVVRDYLGIDLGGLEKLESLETLYLVNLGLVSLSDVQPVLDLLSVGNLTNLRVINNPLDPSAKAALESLFPGCVQ